MTKSVTFRTDSKNIRLLDQLAKSLDRDRSYLINEAINDFLEVQKWQLAAIDSAVKGADAGNFASDKEVAKAFAAFKTGH